MLSFAMSLVVAYFVIQAVWLALGMAGVATIVVLEARAGRQPNQIHKASESPAALESAQVPAPNYLDSSDC